MFRAGLGQVNTIGSVNLPSAEAKPWITPLNTDHKPIKNIAKP